MQLVYHIAQTLKADIYVYSKNNAVGKSNNIVYENITIDKNILIRK